MKKKSVNIDLPEINDEIYVDGKAVTVVAVLTNTVVVEYPGVCDSESRQLLRHEEYEKR